MLKLFGAWTSSLPKSQFRFDWDYVLQDTEQELYGGSLWRRKIMFFANFKGQSGMPEIKISLIFPKKPILKTML
jgi:hypothetical protein